MLVTLLLVLLGGGLLCLALDRFRPEAARLVSLLTLVVAALILASLAPLGPASAGPGNAWLAYVQMPWIPRFGISIELGLDGLSFLLLVLTLALGFIAVSASWTEISFRPGLFQANLLWTLAGVVGVFLALDLFLFFVFWEIMLVPMYLLIAVWGHEARAHAAYKFFIFTQVSGLLMLLAILVLAWTARTTGQALSFSYFDLLGQAPTGQLGMAIMLGFFIAFAVKLPAFGVHTWLPDAHTQAPTAGSVLLAGILLKTGAYGLIRFVLPLFPESSLAFAPIALGLGVAGILYGAVLAFAQDDFKRLVAYSSVSHMGFVLLGLYAFNALAQRGAVVQLVAHGISTAALFMMAGALQQRLHTRDMRKMGGLWQQAPRMGACALFFAMASLGLPGLGNFVAEFMVLAGLFAEHPITAALAALGLVTAAIYSLSLIQRAFQGPDNDQAKIDDFGPRELTTMAVMAAALLWLGLYPQPVLDLARIAPPLSLSGLSP